MDYDKRSDVGPKIGGSPIEFITKHCILVIAILIVIILFLIYTTGMYKKFWMKSTFGNLSTGSNNPQWWGGGHHAGKFGTVDTTNESHPGILKRRDNAGPVHSRDQVTEWKTPTEKIYGIMDTELEEKYLNRTS